VAAELFHADREAERWTDMTKLIVAFYNFANAPKKQVTMLSVSAHCRFEFETFRRLNKTWYQRYAIRVRPNSTVFSCYTL
jgi:hypothetical protein